MENEWAADGVEVSDPSAEEQEEVLQPPEMTLSEKLEHVNAVISVLDSKEDEVDDLRERLRKFRDRLKSRRRTKQTLLTSFFSE